MRSILMSVVVTAAALVGACVVSPAKTPVAPPERPIAHGLSVSLDGKLVETTKDGSTRLTGRGPEAFRIVATTTIERHPYPGESLTAILTSGERVVKQAPFVVDAVRGRARLDVPGPGTYRLEIWTQDRLVEGNTFVAASLPALDGQRVLELHQNAGPRLYVTSEGTGSVKWMHWDSVDADGAFVAEWWKDGKRFSAAGGKRSEFQREVMLKLQTSDQPEMFGELMAWRWLTEQFPLPDRLTTEVGRWELRVYRDDKSPVAFGFQITPDGLVQGAQRRTVGIGNVELEVASAPASKEASRQLAKLPGSRFEASKKYLLPVTVAEIRALTRSEVLRGMRVRLNTLERQKINDSSGTYQFGDRDESPRGIEAHKLVSAMQKLIAMLGEPWTDSERP